MPTTPDRAQQLKADFDLEDRAAAARRPSFLFSPDNAAIEHALLEELSRPDESLLVIAKRHRTTCEALSLWMTRPDIERRITATRTAAAQRNQLAAQFALADAITSLHETVKQHPKIEADRYLDGYSIPHLDYKRHTREAARKAANLLHRIAHPPAPRPSPRGTGVPAASSLSGTAVPAVSSLGGTAVPAVSSLGGTAVPAVSSYRPAVSAGPTTFTKRLSDSPSNLLPTAFLGKHHLRSVLARQGERMLPLSPSTPVAELADPTYPLTPYGTRLSREAPDPSGPAP